MVQEAMGNRAIAFTAMNANSSRSHCLIILTITTFLLDGSGRYRAQPSTLRHQLFRPVRAGLHWHCGSLTMAAQTSV